MKKVAKYVAIALVAAVSCGIGLWFSEYSEKPEDYENAIFPIPLIKGTPLLDSLHLQMKKDRKTEMDYYLDRHNVEDEGYEMVAAFAAGKQHQ